MHAVCTGCTWNGSVCEWLEPILTQKQNATGNPAVWRRKRMAQVGARVASTRHQERPCFTDLDEFETRFAESRSNRPGTAESGSELC